MNGNPHIRQCCSSDCQFRYPVTNNDRNFSVCPKCGNPTDYIIDIPNPRVEKADPVSDCKIAFLLDNLRSVFNVGSIFRSADGTGIVSHLYLCGTTPTPLHPKMAKTALGAENEINWSYHRNGFNLAQQLIEQGNKLVALEITESSVQLKYFLQRKITSNMIFIVGNELTGIDPEILAIAQEHIHLPMHGVKESLNVAIAASILCYSLA
jgi:tRNA G18 (ribose-2'-O)-methylase SpoU